MSNSLAIAAVTATLRTLLSDGLGVEVTARPPDRAGEGLQADRVNLFLYQTQPSAAFRNMDMPRQVRPGETGHPPLPLVLNYLVAAYGTDEDDLARHRLLGRAMSILHDRPVLRPQDIATATGVDLPDSDLHQQLESVRLTLQPLSLEEISKLWAAFQTPYRVAAAYQASVVLIESRRPIKAALPVLARGESDRGVTVVGGPLPALAAVRPASGLPGVRLGEALRLAGEHLAGESVGVLFSSPRLAAPVAPAELTEATAAEVVARLPEPGDPLDPGSPAAAWPAGVYTASVVTGRAGEPDRRSNELPFALAPAITVAPLAAAPGDLALTVTCLPLVWPEQRVSLLFGEREVPAPARTEKTGTLDFQLGDVAAGGYVVRLRVDGIDSVPVDPVAPTTFAAGQVVLVEAP